MNLTKLLAEQKRRPAGLQAARKRGEGWINIRGQYIQSAFALYPILVPHRHMSSLQTNFAPKGRLGKAGKNRLAHFEYNVPNLFP
jgi:hypothetical protein